MAIVPGVQHTPNFRLDLKPAGYESKVMLDELMVPEVRRVKLMAEAGTVTTLTLECFVSPDTIVDATPGHVRFEIAGIELPEATRREIYDALKAEFE
jgi:hypothetical protein